MRLPLPKSRWGRFTLLAFMAFALLLPAAAVYYESTGGAACGRCHEIGDAVSSWMGSSHRSVDCKHCHGGLWTLDPAFHLGNVRRLFTHFLGTLPERVRIKDSDVDGIVARCRECHRDEFADWEAGPHGMRYKAVFLDEEHNRKRLLMDDCLRCHGMFLEEGIRDLVQPLNTEGPWRLLDPGMAERPAIPCLACHSIHRDSNLAERDSSDTEPESPQVAASQQPLHRPSLAFFDRRGQRHVPNALLPLPAVRDGERDIRMGDDTRQAICYQCHAPLASLQAGSGDDRTCEGVHEGLSCFACHVGHGQQTRASCRECHPKLSNCGLSVESMDTTFRDPESPHDIHVVECVDCHVDGVPGRDFAEDGASE